MERKAWVNSYMSELNRSKRREILDKAIEEEGLSPENELRKKLWESRYGHQADGEVDYFIRGWMSMFYLGTSAKGLFAARKIAREKAAIRSDWKMDLAAGYGSTGETVLYEELYNMARLYIDLCRHDRTYSSYLLGLGTLNEDALSGKIAKDIYQTAFVTAEEIGTGDEFAVFRKAAADAFCDVYPNEKHLLQKHVRKERE